MGKIVCSVLNFPHFQECGRGRGEGIYIELIGTLTEVKPHLQTCDSCYSMHLCNYLLDLGMTSKTYCL